MREPRTPSATLDPGRAGASGTIGTLVAWLCGSLAHHRHLGSFGVRKPRAPSATLAPGRAGAPSTIGTLVPWLCGSLAHHRQRQTLVVREHRAPSAPWCLRCAEASDTIGNVGPWSCGSTGHHRHLGALAVRQPRTPSATGTLVVLEHRAPSAPWCLGCAGASDAIGNVGPWWCGIIGRHRHLGALAAREPRSPRGIA